MHVIGGFLLGYGLAGLATGKPEQEICIILIILGITLIAVDAGIKMVTND